MQTKNSIKICYIDESPAIGGAEVYLKLLVENFSQQHEVCIVHLGDETHWRYYNSKAVRQVALPEMGQRGMARLAGYYRLLKWLSPDILHVNQPAPDRCFHAIIAGHFALAKAIVSTCHLPGAVFRRSLLGIASGKSLTDHLITRTAFNCLDKVIVVSRSGLAELERNYPIPSGRATCVPNGVDCEKYRGVSLAAVRSFRDCVGIPADCFLLVSVGRLHDQKGYDVLISAFAAVCSRCSAAELVIVGEGELRKELEQLACQLGVERRVHLIGQRMDIPEILAACDIYLNTSRYEGLPFSILEAMASGLPVIASAINGNREVVNDDTGILVAPGDESQLVEAILSLVGDKEKRKVLGAAGRDYVARCFSLSGMIAQTERVYLNAARS